MSTQIALSVVEAIIERGIDCYQVMEEVGLRWDRLRDQDAVIPLRKYIQFFEQIAVKANDPYLGLHLSLANGPHSIGAVGFMVMSSPTLHEALASLAR